MESPLNNLENVLQKNLRIERTGEFIFRAPRDANFENFCTQCQSWWCLCGLDVWISPQKKLWICHGLHMCVRVQV